jgi:exocyst complex protein 7
MSTSSANSGMAGSTELYSTAKLFAEIRGSYVARSLTNMASATLSTARARNPESFYKKGDCSISSYKVALHGMLAAEYDNIRIIFAPEECTKLMLATSKPALKDFGKAMADLNSMILENLMRDCFLAYETMDIVTKMGGQLGDMAGLEIQKPIRELLRPVHNTAKASIGKMLEHTKNSVQRLATLPQEGAAIPATIETMERMRALGDFLPPVLKVITAVGDGNWGPIPGSPNLNGSPSLRSFDTTLTGTTAGGGSTEGRQILIHFCSDILETLITALDSRSRLLLKNQGVQSVFMLNNIAVIDGMLKSHDVLGELLLGPASLGPTGQGIQTRLDTWRSKWIKLYIQAWTAASMALLDVQYTSRGSRRSAAAMNKDSEAIVAAMTSKEREATKEKFRSFNVAFDELVQKHRTYRMERDVKSLLAKEVSQTIEPLYGRFWDRYHEVDRKGKYVKYDKVTLGQVLAQLA